MEVSEANLKSMIVGGKPLRLRPISKTDFNSTWVRSSEELSLNLVSGICSKVTFANQKIGFNSLMGTF